MTTPAPESRLRRTSNNISRWRDTRRGTKQMKAGLALAANTAARTNPALREQIGRARLTQSQLQELVESHYAASFGSQQGQDRSAAIQQTISDRIQSAGPGRRNRISRWFDRRRGTKALTGALTQAAKDVKNMDGNVRQQAGQRRFTAADLSDMAMDRIREVIRPEGIPGAAPPGQQQQQPQAQQQPDLDPLQQAQQQVEIARLQHEQTRLQMESLQMQVAIQSLQTQLANQATHTQQPQAQQPQAQQPQAQQPQAQQPQAQQPQAQQPQAQQPQAQQPQAQQPQAQQPQAQQPQAQQPQGQQPQAQQPQGQQPQGQQPVVAAGQGVDGQAPGPGSREAWVDRGFGNAVNQPVPIQQPAAQQTDPQLATDGLHNDPAQGPPTQLVRNLSETSEQQQPAPSQQAATTEEAAAANQNWQAPAEFQTSGMSPQNQADLKSDTSRAAHAAWTGQAPPSVSTEGRTTDAGERPTGNEHHRTQSQSPRKPTQER
ncbi:hypothetical protein ACWCOV_39265 [Kribbella sp. NPDC002412]